ncbi:MAG: hypothetical protein HOY75_13255 [Streptomyces sp.]|nr:hypothetical protein [Streptomyces sp.]
MIRSNRARRATLRQRRTQTRAQSRIRKNGRASLATHAIATGLRPTEARSVAGSLRKAAAKLGIDGQACTVFKAGRARHGYRYTPSQVAILAATYKPRKPAYKTAAAKLALAA